MVMRRKEHVLADVDPYHARDATWEDILWSGSIRIKQSLKVGKKFRLDLYAMFGKSCLATRVPPLYFRRIHLHSTTANVSQRRLSNTSG